MQGIISCIYLVLDSARALNATFVVTNVRTRTPPLRRKGKGTSNPCPPEKKRRARKLLRRHSQYGIFE
jgi:hypothetical protein